MSFYAFIIHSEKIHLGLYLLEYVHFSLPPPNVTLIHRYVTKVRVLCTHFVQNYTISCAVKNFNVNVDKSEMDFPIVTVRVIES